MKRALSRVLVVTLLFAGLLAARLPAPSGTMQGGSAPAGPKTEPECKKAMSDLDAEYVMRHLALTKEFTARRQKLLVHCMSLDRK